MRIARAALALVPAATALVLPSVGRAQEPRDAGFDVVGATFVAIQVADLAEAARWYEAALALTTVNAVEADDGSYAVRILTDGRLTVELIRARGVEAPATDPHLGLFKAGFFVDDIEAAHAWLRRHGARTDEAVFVDDALEVRSFVWRDPFGNRLQVFERCPGTCAGGVAGRGSPPGGAGGWLHVPSVDR